MSQNNRSVSKRETSLIQKRLKEKSQTSKYEGIHVNKGKGKVRIPFYL